MCRVRRGDGTYKQCRALLDTCAAAHFITEDVAKELRLPIRPYSIPINAINDTRTRSTGIIEITIQSLDSRYKRNLSLLIVPKIADQVPSEVFPRELIKIPIDRKLADPQFHLPRPVDILIGSGATLSLMSVGQFRLSRARGDLILQKTQLGWVVVGGIDSEESKEETALFATTELRDQLERFWLIEDAIVTRTEGTQEVECETHYTQNTKRDETGRYIVRLPFREKGHDYSELYHIALRRFHNLWKKLNANPELRKEYERTMQEYLTLGHMSLVEDDPTGGCYLPHHAVIKSTSTTTKVRVVFDALQRIVRAFPLIVHSKILIQDCWKTKVEWDESVPNALHSSWTRFAEQLKLIDNLTIERRLIIDNHNEVQIHGFCDASQAGYGGSLYVRSRDQVGNVHVRLFCAKSRVAPLKDKTIPRLELCGALTLARLYREIRASCGIRPNKIIFWSDSTIVLGWLRKDPNTLKQFTANRVREIQEICVGITWRHVRTENNPADALSRGRLPREFIKNNSWFHGPSWLRRPELEWPIQTETETDELPELKKIPLLMTRIEPESIFRRFSNYTRLLTLCTPLSPLRGHRNSSISLGCPLSGDIQVY
ncbi:uncharacterized protein LOC122521603 [Polistes fuscatus]|uniref:uncharacterized protein LOC122521603 n=1 Tax=Polistes fuscatus TaxID=30207 RepID=UPI001CA99411|nr:uncharacterized protein LOC122521603 [Polistes fuscatus]